MATSTGDIQLFSFDPEHEAPISQLDRIVVAPVPEIMLLCLAWSPLSPTSIAVSLSDGTVAIVDTMNLTVVVKIPQAHSLEAWVVAWSNVAGSNSIYSGGDDSVFCRHRLKENPKQDSAQNRLSLQGSCIRDRKIHSAGVTSILTLCKDDQDGEILLTGSYDESVRVLRVAPGLPRPKILAEKRLHGGVWQMRCLKVSGASTSTYRDRSCFSILASCMHAGCRVLQVRYSADHTWTIVLVGTFEGHESMNYASDVQLPAGGQTLEDLTFASTSFYDKKLCVWQLENSGPVSSGT